MSFCSVSPLEIKRNIQYIPLHRPAIQCFVYKSIAQLIILYSRSMATCSPLDSGFLSSFSKLPPPYLSPVQPLRLALALNWDVRVLDKEPEQVGTAWWLHPRNQNPPASPPSGLCPSNSFDSSPASLPLAACSRPRALPLPAPAFHLLKAWK